MTQSKQILSDLKAGKHITPLDALRDYGSFRLGARIYDLKQDGHQISTQRVTMPSGRSVASYSMVNVKNG